MFSKVQVRSDKAMVKWGRTNRITIRKMFDAERKELTDEFPVVNIL